MNCIGQVHGPIQRACLDVQRLEVTGALMPQSRSAIAAVGTFQRMSGGRWPRPELWKTLYDIECVSLDSERDAKRGRRLLLTFSAMANVQRQRLPWRKVPNTSALTAATLAFVWAVDCCWHMPYRLPGGSEGQRTVRTRDSCTERNECGTSGPKSTKSPSFSRAISRSGKSSTK